MGFSRWQWYYNNTQHTKIHTASKQNTAHKAAQTIKDTLHTVNTTEKSEGPPFLASALDGG
jgi:hypothetical protein